MFSKSRSHFLIGLAVLLLAFCAPAGAEEPSAKPVPKVIQIETGGQGYQELLGGPPESVTMRAGAVTLQPGQSVGKHGTENYEEFIVVLEGQGSMIVVDGPRLEMKAGAAVYCPPDTEHDVKNTGSVPLKYIYIVAKTR